MTRSRCTVDRSIHYVTAELYHPRVEGLGIGVVERTHEQLPGFQSGVEKSKLGPEKIWARLKRFARFIKPAGGVIIVTRDPLLTTVARRQPVIVVNDVKIMRHQYLPV